MVGYRFWFPAFLIAPVVKFVAFSTRDDIPNSIQRQLRKKFAISIIVIPFAKKSSTSAPSVRSPGSRPMPNIHSSSPVIDIYHAGSWPSDVRAALIPKGSNCKSDEDLQLLKCWSVVTRQGPENLELYIFIQSIYNKRMAILCSAEFLYGRFGVFSRIAQKYIRAWGTIEEISSRQILFELR